MSVVDGVLGGGSERLLRFREHIASERTAMSPRFTTFKENVSDEIARRPLVRLRGVVPLVGALVAFAGAGILMFFLAIQGWRSVYPRWNDVVLLGLGVAAFLNALILLGAVTQRRLWRRRSADANLEAERWEAFRRYLTDFPRLEEAPPATLALWERYLVYGIAFGIAERVLQAAHLAMPEELAEQSSIYWISPAATSARAQPRSRSAISRPGSARRSRRPRRARAEAAEDSPVAEEEAAAVEAAGPGDRYERLDVKLRRSASTKLLSSAPDPRHRRFRLR